MMLSHTLIWSNSLTSWKVLVRPWAGVSYGFTTLSPTPSMITMPPSRGRVPLSRFIRVDFPEPLGPTMLVIPFRLMAMERQSTALTAPKCLEISWVSRATSSPGPLPVLLTACTSRPGPGA